MKLRDALTIALLGMLIGSTYAYMAKTDEESAQRERAAWTGKADK